MCVENHQIHQQTTTRELDYNNYNNYSNNNYMYLLLEK